MRVLLILLVSLCGVFAQKGKGKSCTGGQLGGYLVDPCGIPVNVDEYLDLEPDVRLELPPGLLELFSMHHGSLPMISPTKSPTKSPSNHPTRSPSKRPSGAPTAPPTRDPSRLPTTAPTISPTSIPSRDPTNFPSQAPTNVPSQVPSGVPSNGPTSAPSKGPTSASSKGPTSAPSNSRTSAPSNSPATAPSKGPTSAPSRGPSIAPTRASTSAPSKGPSSASTGASTSAPSKGLSSAPTGASTSAPSKGPSSAPTGASTSAPSKGPSSAPSNAPTNPTFSPTQLQTDAFTAFPTRSSTVAPAELKTRPSTPRPSLSPTSTCQTQSGFFGSMTKNAIIIEFGYELETDPSVEGKVEDEVLPVLENNLNSFLLPVVFPFECGGSDGSTQDQSIVGIAARPDDLVLEEFECNSTGVAGNICQVIRAEITLFTNDGRRLEVGEDQILDALRSGMEDGAFVVAHSSIVRVSFVDLGDLEEVEPSPIETPIQDSEGLMVGLVMAAAGAALVVIGALVYRRRKHSGDDDAGKRTLAPVIIPELASPYGSMLDSEAPDVLLLSPTDSSIFFDSEVVGEPSPLSGHGDVTSPHGSILKLEVPDTPLTPSDASIFTSIDDDDAEEPSSPPDHEETSVSEESSETTSSTT